MENTTNLHRQVHPNFLQENQVSFQAFSVTSQIFKPTTKDNGKLSMYNGDKFTAENAFSHFTQAGFSSVGVLSISVGECANESLPVEEDNVPFDGHTSIYFKDMSGNDLAKKAKKLKKYALERGWQYGPIL